ncbi:SART-1 family [Raphanus sativus]|uniref:SART-1 family protein DOT2 n=1 Tax=Raphanus sativus TaxID=3726 RepID=A0A6J0P0X0_RAPSA|nr:SART-1 family protein DOT2 [Raphanus sativus]KAJ4893628.1 SART-1 family [Raphanus sativus]
MSQLNIVMKKNSMRKNKKLVINIASIKKEGLASRFEADHKDLGSSIKNEKRRFESSERQRDIVFDRRVCSKADEEIDHHGSRDRSSVRDGVMMREVDVGTGLSGALKLLREQGTFKEKSSSKLVGVGDNHGKVDRFKDVFNDIRIDRVDEYGRILTEKEAFKKLCHGFHGKKLGKRKQEKRIRIHEDSSKNILESSDRVVERMRLVHAELKSPYIIL